jgi:hypothetical protein
MKLAINTQYRENYGTAQDPYWKFKGGTTYVVPNFTDSVIITEVMKTLTTLITYGNSGSEEYIIDYNIVDNSEKVCESWETPTQIFFNTDNVTTLKVTDNREDGYMKSEILEKTEAWTMLPDSNRSDYSVSFLMQDGDICDSESDLKNWFDTCGQVEVV